MPPDPGFFGKPEAAAPPFVSERSRDLESLDHAELLRTQALVLESLYGFDKRGLALILGMPLV